MSKTSLKLEGLHCYSCVNTIEKSLKNKKGIITLDISFARQEANIEFDEKLISEDTIIQIIKNAGYKAHHGNQIDSDIKKRWRLFWFGLVLTIPIFIIDTILKKSGFSWHLLLFILATPVQIFLGWPFYKGTYFAIKQKTIDMNLLVALSTSAAYLYSLYITFLSHGAVFFGAAATILTTITLGNLLEKISQGKVSDAINKLIQLKPKKAHIIRDNKELEVTVNVIIK